MLARPSVLRPAYCGGSNVRVKWVMVNDLGLHNPNPQRQTLR